MKKSNENKYYIYVDDTLVSETGKPTAHPIYATRQGVLNLIHMIKKKHGGRKSPHTYSFIHRGKRYVAPYYFLEL